MDEHEDDHDHYLVVLFDAFGVADIMEICEHDLHLVNVPDSVSDQGYMTIIPVSNTKH